MTALFGLFLSSSTGDRSCGIGNKLHGWLAGPFPLLIMTLATKHTTQKNKKKQELLSAFTSTYH